MKRLKLDGVTLSLVDLKAFLCTDGVTVSAADDARRRVKASARFCSKIAQSDEAYYGINTGFGVLANKRIPKDTLAQLQKNLLRSHASRSDFRSSKKT
jgi:histidine ammonia-lyase